MPVDERIKSNCVDQITRYIQQDGLTPKEAFDRLSEEYTLMGVSSEILEALDDAYKEVDAEVRNIQYLTIRQSIRQRREPWYSGPKDTHYAWPAYRQHLIDKGWKDTIDSIDESSTKVVSLLHNPGLPRFNGRGLVLGYVQSGKTANMAAVIAKASDAGYRLIIVLTGMIEKLRQQTQQRFQKDLFDHDSEQKWENWTTNEDDFSHNTHPGFQFAPGSRNIMIVKKNKDILARILEKLDNTARHVLTQVPVLVIDDECDQASVAAANKENEWPIINRRIREILGKFQRIGYVGYTATPFANVLIDPAVVPDREDDLYPRDFIFSLPKPENYFGAERIFGRDMLEGEAELALDEELDMIRLIPDEEIARLRPAKQSDQFEFQVTAKLEEAIDYFFIATAIRNKRGHRGDHSTMLIHTSMKVDTHSDIYTEVLAYLTQCKSLIEKRDTVYFQKLGKLLDRESAKVSASIFDLEAFSFDNLIDNILETISVTEVVVENSQSPSGRLDYESAKEGEGKRYICIGGNVLARGLTLEGLVSSFFVRTASQYDTLLQMGRWFGYRIGYEDLPRVWMTSELADNFMALATVEAEIREQIEVYERDEDITPLDVAVAIRQIPGLAITAKNKMLAAEECGFSFSNAHKQTTRFYHQDHATLTSNWMAGERLIDQALEGNSFDIKTGGHLISGVDRSLVEEFLSAYRIHESQKDLVDTGGNSPTNHLMEYISKEKQRNSESLRLWNVGIIQKRTRAKSDDRKVSFGQLRELSMTGRAQLRPISTSGANIKALMSRVDIGLDLPVAPSSGDKWDEIKAERRRNGISNPLLLLYLIDKDSQPNSGAREPLDAVHDVLGFGIVFPISTAPNEPTFRVRVRLPDPDDAEEAMLSEEAELES